MSGLVLTPLRLGDPYASWDSMIVVVVAAAGAGAIYVRSDGG